MQLCKTGSGWYTRTETWDYSEPHDLSFHEKLTSLISSRWAEKLPLSQAAIILIVSFLNRKQVLEKTVCVAAFFLFFLLLLLLLLLLLMLDPQL